MWSSREQYYKHNDPNHSDCDRQNADSHLRAMLLGPLGDDADQRRRAGGGPWQRVLCGEMDGPRTRTIRAQVMGIAS